MPLNNPAPNFALLTALDMRGQSGETIFTRNSNAVALPSFATGEGIYEDLLFFLNSRFSSSTVNASAQLVNTAGLCLLAHLIKCKSHQIQNLK
jgi:hypothetical protein